VHNMFVRENTKSTADPRGCALSGIVGSNPAEAIYFCVFVNIVCCEVEFSAMGRALLQRSPTECCVCLEYDQVHQ